MRGAIRHLLDAVDAGYREAFISLLERRPGARLLDCGVGDGQFTIRIGSRVHAQEIWGIEISAKNASEASRRGIRVRTADLNKRFPFQDAFFDVVTANQVIEHLCDTDSFLREIFRILRPGGSVLIGTPNLASLHNLFYLALGLQPYWCNVSDEVLVGTWHPTSPAKLAILDPMVPKHRRLFTSRALREMLDHHGFKVKELRLSGFYPFPPFLGRIIGSMFRSHGAIIVAKAEKLAAIPMRE